MQKRAAFGQQGSKDGDGDFGQSPPDDQPTRATAAQLANRKIKDIRKRRAPTPSAGGGASFNPFASAAAAPTQSAGFTFGQTPNQSQSFPGANPGGAPGGIFSSGTNGQAGGAVSFNFAGPTSFGSPPASNPFSVNTSFGGTSQPGSDQPSFGGFKVGGIGNESTPASTPAPSFGGFGTQQTTSTPASSGLFGQSTPQTTSPADDSMQTSPDAKPTGGSIFAQNTTTGGPPPANPFASLSGQIATNPFAPKPAAKEDTTKSAETQPLKPLFGSAATSKPDEVNSQTAASNLFSPKPASDGAASNPFANLPGQTPASSSIFAPKTTTDTTPAKPAEAAKPFRGLFASSTTPKTMEPANNMFGPKPAAEAPETKNPFAKLSTPKTTWAEEGAGKAAETQPFSMFGTPATSEAADAGKEPAPSPAFGNMFATAKPSAENESPKTSTDPQPFKSLFGTPAVSKAMETGGSASTTSAFGEKFATGKPAAEGTATKPMFAAPVASNPGEAEKTQTLTPPAAAPFGSLFGASSAPAKSGEGQTAPAPSNIFANSAQAPVTSPFRKTTEEPPAILFGASTGAVLGGKPAQASEDHKIANAFQSPFSKPQATTIDKEGATPNTTTRALSSQAPSTNKHEHLPLSSSSSSLPPSSSFTPSTYPYNIANTRSAQEVDSLFPQSSNPASIEAPEMSLRSLFPKPGSNPAAVTQYQKLVFLTESFKRQIAKCDPEIHNIDENIILYAELRRQIGIPLGSIDPDEEEKRDMINSAEAAEEARSAGEPIAAPKPPPPTFHPFSTFPGKNATPKPTPGASDTLNKFKQSFSSSSGPSAPAASSTPTAAPVPNVIATPAVIAAESSKASPAAPASAIPNFGKGTTAPAPMAPASAIFNRRRHNTTPAPMAPPSAIFNSKRDTTTPAPSAPASTTSNFGKDTTAPAPSASAVPKFGKDTTAPAPSAPASAIPKFGKDTTAPALSAPALSAPASSAPTPTFTMPKLGNATGATDFMAQFKARAEKSEANDKAKRKAQEFDSDEDDEAEWERKDAEKQREKHAKYQTNKPAVFVPGQGLQIVGKEATTTAIKPDSTQAASPSLFTNPTSSTSTPAFAMPKLGNASGATDFMAQFKARAAKSAANEKAKRKAEEFDSEEDDEAEWERKDAEKQREKHAKYETNSTPTFTMPKLGNATGATDFMAQFKARAAKSAADEKAKRKAEEFDSEEDDETEWERKDAEKQREKHAKYETNKRSVFIPSQDVKIVEDKATTISEPAPSKSTELIPPPKAASLDPPVEPISSASAASTFTFGVNGSTSLPPVSKPLFGAKPPASSTPSSTSSVFGNAQPVPLSQNIFGGLTSTSPKRKSSADESDDESPTKKNKPSPPASSATGLFGRVSKPPIPALTPPATNLSDASVPVAPDSSVSAETASSAVAATEDGEGKPGETFNLANSNLGEEDETVVLEKRAKAFELHGDQFAPLGVGLVRILKHSGTGRTRVVLRAEPSGKVILNSLLKKEFAYIKCRNSVQFDGLNLDGKLVRFALKVKEHSLDILFDKINESKY